MARGRGSAVVAAAVICLLVVVLHCQVAQAATYFVGGRAGWTFNVTGWTRGKRFKAGDVLVFNYMRGAHNVVGVSTAGYNSCSSIPRNAKVYTSGKDQIRLVKGVNSFICTFPGHCAAGMKILVSAT